MQYPTVRETTSGISVSEQKPTVHCAAIAYNNTRLCRDFAWQEIISGVEIRMKTSLSELTLLGTIVTKVLSYKENHLLLW